VQWAPGERAFNRFCRNASEDDLGLLWLILAFIFLVLVLAPFWWIWDKWRQ
jgi:hypothetical protein